MFNEKDFVDYCFDFYNEEKGIYPMLGVDKKAITLAMKLLPVYYPDCPVEFDSIDREHVRDILSDVAGYKFKKELVA
jgi:hypothetical protein